MQTIMYRSDKHKVIFYSTGNCTLSYVCVSRSVVSDSASPWAAACQAPLSVGFPRKENIMENSVKKKKKTKSLFPHSFPSFSSSTYHFLILFLLDILK